MKTKKQYFELLMSYQCKIAEQLLELFSSKDVCNIIFTEGGEIHAAFDSFIPIEDELKRITNKHYKLLI